MADYVDPLWNATYKTLHENANTDIPTTQQGSSIPTDQDQSENNEIENIIIIVILCLFSTVGTLGNGLVLYVFTRTAGKLTSTIFILALAGTDFVTCLVILPYTVVAIHLSYMLEFDLLCKMYQFLITCTVPLSAFIMVAIAVDRYICICHPFTHFMTVKRAKVIVGILALFATILGLITSLGFGVYRMSPKPESVLNSTNLLFATNASVSFNLSNEANSFASDMKTNKYHIEEEVPVTLYKEFVGLCDQSTVLLSYDFIKVYQKIYSAFYLCSLLIVLILYGLIYSSVTKQRAKRRAQKMGSRVKQVNTHCQTDESTIPLTNMNAKKQTHSNYNNVNLKVEIDGATTCTMLSKNQENGINESESRPDTKVSIRKSPTVDQNKDRRDHDRLANIKTAVMLFIVTIVFIIAFLPAWLMAHHWLTFNPVVFYMYFAYNVANPVIYAFMNQTFRDNMHRLFNTCRLCFNSR